MPAAQAAHFTECGLTGLRAVPYGTHMCHFYRDRDELVAATVPYVIAGLRARERCIWVTSQPLESAAAARELIRAGVDLVDAFRNEHLMIWDYDDWYLKNDNLNTAEVCRLWLKEEARALDDGYAGLRITGNVSFLTPRNWPDFMDYERAVDEAFSARRIIALCSYSRRACGISEVFDVVRHHNCALERPDEGWQVFTPPAR